MKLNHFTSALAATFVLAACSVGQTIVTTPVTDSAVVTPSQTAQQTKEVIVGHEAGVVRVESKADAKSIIYRCQGGKQISATYAFIGEEARAVNLVLTEGKQSQAMPTLIRDNANHDFASFTSDGYIWNLDNSFTRSTAMQSDAGMLTKKGGESDPILAKMCDVHHKLTHDMNR